MTDDRPLYLRVVEDLRKKIKSGELPPGSRLPSRPEIMQTYGVSNTVALRVGDILKAEGLAEARSGSGTYVRGHPAIRRVVRSFTLRLAAEGSPFLADMKAQGQRATWTHESRTAVASPEIRMRLALDEGDGQEDVVKTTYVYTTGDEPTELATSWEPLAITRGTPVVLPEDGPGVGVMERMRIIGVKVAGAVEHVRARLATAEESGALRLPPGSIVFAIRRTYYDVMSRPVETADIVISAEKYELVYGEAVPDRRET